jgi:tight adherence protein C
VIALLYIIVFLCFIILSILFYESILVLSKNKIAIKYRIKQIKDIESNSISESDKIPFSQSALMSFYEKIIQILIKATPSGKITLLKKKLEKAGLFKNRTPENWIYTRVMVMVILSTLFGLLCYLIEPNFFKSLIIILLMMLLINTCFNFYISKKITARKRMMVRELPYTLDLITVSVEAGLSFDGAMTRVIANISGELCDEFSKTLKEMRMGIQRKVALKNMSDRCEVKELSMLLTSLIQADDLGVGLSNVLRVESEGLREHRKQAAREQAMKAPIKMLFPLLFFIFPSIFIVILGPAIIKIIKIL